MGPAHAQQALELATLTNPGPFGPRTLELGDYYGYFRGGHLIAMAGERMYAGNLREVSGVCTHPDHQGNGYARLLMHKVIAQQLRRPADPVSPRHEQQRARARTLRALGVPRLPGDDGARDLADLECGLERHL